MRRVFVVATIWLVAFVAAVPAAGAAPNKTKNVDGVFNGAGGFVFNSSCPLIIDATTGTYRAKHLGRGTYSFHICVTNPGLLHAVGTFDLVTRSGAQLHGAIDTDLPTPLHGVPVTIADGTRRFARATGTLVLDFVMFNETNCDPRVGICLNWDERGTITGTITTR